MLTDNAAMVARQWFFGDDAYLGSSSLGYMATLRLPNGGLQECGAIYQGAPVRLSFDNVFVNIPAEYLNRIEPEGGTIYAVGSSMYHSSMSALVFGEGNTPEAHTDYKMDRPLSAGELCPCRFELVDHHLIASGQDKDKMKNTYRVYLKNCSGRPLQVCELGRFVTASFGTYTTYFVLVERQTFAPIYVPVDNMLILDYSTVF